MPMPHQPQYSRRHGERLDPWFRDSAAPRPGPTYRINWTSIAVAAVAAATGITLYMMYVPRLLGVKSMDIGITIGAMADPSGGLVAYLTRIAWHVVHGIAYVPFYAALLIWLQKQSSARTGVA